MGAAAVLIAGVCSLSGIAGALERGDPDWGLRAAYIYTHVNTWRDFRPTLYRIAGFLEMARRGMRGVQHYPGEPEKFHWAQRDDYLSKDEAVDLLKEVLDGRSKSRDGRWVVGFGPNFGGGAGWTGQAGVHHSGLGLAYVYAKYAALLPDDLREKLKDTVGDLFWFGDRSLHPYQIYSNIPLSGACGMLLAADYANPALKAEAQKWYDRMFDEAGKYGYYEVISSYSSYQFLSWAAAHELAKDETNRLKARFALDGYLLHLAHLYQPGGNIAGQLDREYGNAVTSRPDTYELFLMFGDPRGNMHPGWYPLGMAAASDYRPPKLLREIAIEKPESYVFDCAFWCSSAPSEGGFETHTPYTGPERNRRGKWMRHHCYMVRGGSVALGGNYGHIWSSRTGSKNLRISFSGGNEPIALTHQHPMAGSDDAFLNEAPTFKRLFRENVVLTVWDPTGPTGGQGENRFPYTVAFVPRGQVERSERSGPWFFMKQGDGYAAYAVLTSGDGGGGVAVEERSSFAKGSRGYKGRPFYFVRTPPRAPAAGVGEVACRDDYKRGGFEAFKKDVLSREITFDAKTKAVTYVARDKKRLAVTYDPERYTVGDKTGGREMLAPRYRLKSPWVEQKADELEVRLTRKGKTVVWDWEKLSIRSR